MSVINEADKEKIVRILWELENASFECGKQGGNDLDAIRKDNVEHTSEDILRLLNTVRVEVARYIQGKLLADEPEVIASNRSEDTDNTWFKAQLAFSDYINDEVIEPYIAELTNKDNI